MAKIIMSDVFLFDRPPLPLPYFLQFSLGFSMQINTFMADTFIGLVT